MGLRDRGTILDFYIPLFAGVQAAWRSRYRLRFPFGIFAPYGPGGTDLPGGLGEGEGGINTPVDPTVGTPTITNPSIADPVMDATETATASAFTSTNGQTHKASRWMIESLADDGTPTGSYIYDSGVTITALEALIFADIGQKPGAKFRITVRYKGSNGGWGARAAWMNFTAAGCATPAGWDSATLCQGGGSTLTLSLNKRTYTSDGGFDSGGWRASLGHATGKFYFELVVGGGGATTAGWLPGVGIQMSGEDTCQLATASGLHTYGLMANGHKTNDANDGGACTTAFGNGAGGTIQFAVDLDAHKVWFGRNNVWVGDPVAGTGAAYTIAAGTYMPCAGTNSYASTVTTNLTAGELTYTPPTGFTAWAPTVTPCSTLPAAPPAPTPPPVSPPPPAVWVPVVAPDPVPGTPVPAPPPPPPTIPAGFPAVALDMVNSYVLADLGCLDNAVTMTQIAAQDGKVVGNYATLILIAQNLSGTADGSVTIGVTADNTRCIVDHPRQVVPVAAGAFVQVPFYLYISGSGDTGTYVITIDTGGGATTKFNLAFTGATSCV